MYSGKTVKGDNMKENKIDKKRITADPFGSYTGRAEDPYERPVQDADDL